MTTHKLGFSKKNNGNFFTGIKLKPNFNLVLGEDVGQ